MNDASAAQALRDVATTAGRVLLTGPIDPDGDSIGACLALARALRALGAAQVDVAGIPGHRYDWMPDANEMIADEGVSNGYDLVVVLDGDRTRLDPRVEAAFHAAEHRGLVDHHASTHPDGYDIVLLDASAASTCEMVCALLDTWGVALDRDLASLIYAGLVFDTGGFRHSNTGPETHRLAARLLEQGIDHSDISVRVLAQRRRTGFDLLGAVLARTRFFYDGQVALAAVPLADVVRIGADGGDIDGIVEMLLFTQGVEVACLCVEKAPGRIKLSLRSRRSVDVAALARSLNPGGGGHVRAAGVLLMDTLDSVMAQLPSTLTDAIRAIE